MQQNQEVQLHCKCVASSTPKKATRTNVNLVIPSPVPKEELKPSTLKVTSSHLSTQEKLELSNEPFFLAEKPCSTHIPFKKTFSFNLEDYNLIREAQPTNL